MIIKELISLINSYLKPLHFKKKETTWYKENPETIVMFNLDKSRFGEIYYVSLCVLFRELSLETRPKFYKTHARIRAEHLGENIEEYLNLEKKIDPKLRKKKILKLLDKSILILKQMETIDGFIGLLKKYNPKLFFLSKPAAQVLEKKGYELHII